MSVQKLSKKAIYGQAHVNCPDILVKQKETPYQYGFCN